MAVSHGPSILGMGRGIQNCIIYNLAISAAYLFFTVAEYIVCKVKLLPNDILYVSAVQHVAVGHM